MIVIVRAHLIIPVHDVSHDCRLQHDWVLAVSNLFLHYIVIGQKWPCSPIPSIFQLKKKGTSKPELNLFWHLLQSSYCEGAPAHWCGMTRSHPGSRQKETLLFSKCIQPCIDILAEMPAHSHLNGKKRERRTQFFKKGEWKITKWHRQQNVNLVKKEERKLFWPQDSKSLI